MDPSLIFLSLAFLPPLAATLPPPHLTTHRRIVEDDVRPCDSSTCAILAFFFHLLFGIVSHQKTNISHLLFGIADSAKSWILRRHFTELWWDPATTRDFFLARPRPKTPHRNLIPITKSPSYKVSADTSKFNYTCRYDSRSAVRIAQIVKERFDLGMPNVRWFIMGGGDTILFPENLVTVLNKYDHREIYYVGTNSESVEKVSVHSYNTAYGGAGFAISYPLATTLVTVLDGCIDRYAELPMHERTRSSTNSRTRVLQHTFCYDLKRNWSVSVSWGYTVHFYPYLMRPKELSTSVETFLTWGKITGPFTFNIRRFKLDPCERPIIFYLDGVVKVDNRSTRSVYSKLEYDERRKKCQNETYKAAYLIEEFKYNRLQLPEGVRVSRSASACWCGGSQRRRARRR